MAGQGSACHSLFCCVSRQDVLMPYFLAKELAGVLGHHCRLTGGKVQTWLYSRDSTDPDWSVLVTSSGETEQVFLHLPAHWYKKEYFCWFSRNILWRFIIIWHVYRYMPNIQLQGNAVLSDSPESPTCNFCRTWKATSQFLGTVQLYICN